MLHHIQNTPGFLIDIVIGIPEKMPKLFVPDLFIVPVDKKSINQLLKQ